MYKTEETRGDTVYRVVLNIGEIQRNFVFKF